MQGNSHSADMLNVSAKSGIINALSAYDYVRNGRNEDQVRSILFNQIEKEHWSLKLSFELQFLLRLQLQYSGMESFLMNEMLIRACEISDIRKETRRTISKLCCNSGLRNCLLELESRVVTRSRLYKKSVFKTTSLKRKCSKISSNIYWLKL